MDVAAKERLIAQIIWGYTTAIVITQNGKQTSLLLHPPTPKEQAKAAGIYGTEYRRVLVEGLRGETDILADMISIGRWSSRQETEIAGLQTDIHKIRRGLLDFVFNRKKLEKTRALLRRAESALLERLSQKHSLMQYSAESHAMVCQQRYLIGRITETEDGELLWPTESAFDKCEDIGIIIQLCDLFFSKSHIPTRLMRELARSQQWRTYWEIAKHTNNLFDNPISHWSSEQRELSYWSTIYDSVYGAFERPSSDIVEDDDLLDSWFIRQGEKLDSKTQNSVAQRPTRPGRNEEFIMADKDGAKRVYAMNDAGSRVQLRARQKLLAEKGSIREQDMPDSQLEIRQQLMERRRKHVKDIGHK